MQLTTRWGRCGTVVSVANVITAVAKTNVLAIEIVAVAEIIVVFVAEVAAVGVEIVVLAAHALLPPKSSW